MNGKPHLTIGFAVSVATIVYSIGSGIPYLALAAVTAPLGAMLPDMDHNRTKMGRVRKSVIDTIKKVIMITAAIAFVFMVYTDYVNGNLTTAVFKTACTIGPVTAFMLLTSSKWFKEKVKFYTEHRGIMHTLLPVACLLFGSYSYSNEVARYLLLGLALGYMSHLFADVCTVAGCPLLWPLTKSTVSILNTRAGGKAEWLLVALISGGIIWIGIYFGHFPVPF